MQGEKQPEWDQLSIETPELVTIEMPIAGVGSRFIAVLVDYLIWTVALVVSVLLILLVDPSLNSFSKLGEKWSIALVILIFFIWYWGYFTLFETFWSGRTPGKRLVKIRVIQSSGRGIGFFEAMIRNLLRVVDGAPAVYAIGVISVLVTRQHQRLGDLAAGTIVVHERQRLEASIGASSRSFTAGLFDPPPNARRNRLCELDSHALLLLSTTDLEILEGFLARRLDLNQETRDRLVHQICTTITARMGVPVPQGIGNESYLEEIAHQLRDLAHLR